MLSTTHNLRHNSVILKIFLFLTYFLFYIVNFHFHSIYISTFVPPLNLNYIVPVSVHDRLLPIFLTHQIEHLEALSVVHFFSVMKMWI